MPGRRRAMGTLLFFGLSLILIISFQNFTVLSSEASEVLTDDGPSLYMPGYDACEIAAGQKQTVKNLVLNVKSFGAFGDGKSHKIGALGAGISANLAKSINLLNTHALASYTDKKTKMVVSHKVNNDDEADWVAIQAALLSAHLNNGGTVLIPDTKGKDYLLSRRIWVYSNIELRWLSASYFRPTQLLGGSVISSANVFDRPVAAAYNDHVCNVRLVNPHVDAGGALKIPLYGQNGISFFNGSQNVWIYGGHVKNAKWGTKEKADKNLADLQGGRAFQFESGVKNIYVNGTRVSNSTIGFSVGAGLCSYKKDGKCNVSDGEYSPWRPHAENWPEKELSRNLTWNVQITKVNVENSDRPFLFYNILYGLKDKDGVDHWKNEQMQKIYLSDFKVKNSGYGNVDILENGEKPDDFSVMTLIGATNVRVHLGDIDNRQLPKINSILWATGRDLQFSQIKYRGNVNSLFDFGSVKPNRGQRVALGGNNITGSVIQHQGSANFMIAGKAVTNTSIGRIEHGKIKGAYFHPSFVAAQTLTSKETFRLSFKPSGQPSQPFKFTYPFFK